MPRPGPGLSRALDRDSFFDQDAANPLAQISLELDGPVDHGAARAAGPLEVLAELLQKRGVLGKAINDADGLSATPGLFDSELGHDARGDGFVGASSTAAAVADRPATPRAHSARIARVDDPRAITVGHAAIMARGHRRTQKNTEETQLHKTLTKYI